jgi:hypothetical protein
MALRLGTRDRLEVQAIQSFSITEQYGYSPVRSDDPQMRMQPAASSAIDREELTRRAEWQAGLMAGRQLSRKVDGDLSYNFTATEYEDDALLSYQTHEAQLDLGWNVTAKSDVLLVASAGMQDSDGYTEPANTAALRIGAGSRHDVKLRYRAAAGVGYMSYSDEIPDSESTALATAARTSEADEGGNSDELRPSFELGLDWTPVRRFSANVSANSGFQPSGQYAANAMYSTAIRAGLSYRFARNWMLKLYGGYRHDDYLEPVDRVVETNISTPTVKFERYDKQTGLWNVGTRMVYEPESARWLNVYVSLSSDTMTSNDDNAEYDAVRATLGATARY